MRCFLILAILLVVPFTSCSLVSTATTPEAAVQRAFHDHPEEGEIQNFVVHETRLWHNQTLVLYTVTRLMEADNRAIPTPIIGYALTERGPQGWNVARSESFGGTPPPQIIAYGSGQLDSNVPIIFGEVFAPNITVVEVSFDAGQPLRMEVDKQVFALIAPHKQKFRELRALDGAGQVVYRSQLPKVIE